MSASRAFFDGIQAHRRVRVSRPDDLLDVLDDLADDEGDELADQEERECKLP